MIPGGWFAVHGSPTQHWRRHGSGEAVCSVAAPPHHHGSLLPKDGAPTCPTCMHIFREVARPHLAHFKAIVARLEILL